MRKDAKIGFAIGGVLLAVLTVYVLVVPQGKKPNHDGVTLVVPPGTTDTPAPQAVSIPPAPAQETVAPKPAVAAKPADAPPAVAKSGDGVNWESILNGKGDAPTIKSVTPSGDSPAPSGPLVDVGPQPGMTDIQLAAVTPLRAPGSTPTPVVAPATQPTAVRSYTIKPGQTLSTIAAEVYGNSRFYVAIKRENPSIDPNHLKPGMRITLPDISDVKPDAARLARDTVPPTSTGKTYKVQSGDTLYRISKSLYGTGRQTDALYELNKDLIGPDKSKLKLGMVLRLPAIPTATVAAATR